MATCSDLARLGLGTLALLVAAAGAAGPVAAQVVRLTQDEALRLAFPVPATIERRTAFLAEDALARARGRAGRDVEIRQSVVTYYVGLREGQPVGAAYFDAHIVRSLREVAMIVVDTAGTIRRVEVLKFEEPPDYQPQQGWVEQLEGKALDARLSLGGGIVNMSGATLTSRALVRASRRVLALHEVIAPFSAAGRRGS